MDKEKINLSACFLYELEDRKVGEMATRPQLDHICWSGLAEIHKVDSFRNQCDETLLDLGSCCLSTGHQDTGVLCGCVSTPQEIMAQFCYRFRRGLLPSALARMSTSQFP